MSTYFEEPRLRRPAKVDAWRAAYVSRMLGRPREAIAARPEVVSLAPEPDQATAATTEAMEPPSDASDRESSETPRSDYRTPEAGTPISSPEEFLTAPSTPHDLSAEESTSEDSRLSPAEFEPSRPMDPIGTALTTVPDDDAVAAATPDGAYATPQQELDPPPRPSIPSPWRMPTVDDIVPDVTGASPVAASHGQSAPSQRPTSEVGSPEGAPELPETSEPVATTVESPESPPAPAAPRRTWKQRLMSGLRWLKSLIFDDAGRSEEGQARQRAGLMAMSRAGLAVPAPAIPPVPVPVGEPPAKQPPSPVARMAEIYVDRKATGDGAKRAEAVAENLKSADKTFFNTNAGRFAAGAAAGAAHTQTNLLYGASHVMHGAEIAARATARHLSGRPELREELRDYNVQRMDRLHLDVAALKASRGQLSTEEEQQSARERVAREDNVVREYPENPDETALAEIMSLDGVVYPGSQKRVTQEAIAQRQRDVEENHNGQMGRETFYSAVRAVTGNLKLGGATLRTGGDLLPEWPMTHTVGDKVPPGLAQQAIARGGSLDPSLRKPADDPEDSTALPRRLARYLNDPGPDLRPAGTKAPLVDAELSRMKQLRKTVEYWTNKQLSGSALSREQVSAMEAMRAEASGIYGRAQQQSDLLASHKGDPVRTVGHGPGAEYRAGGLTSEGGTEEQTKTTVGGVLAQGLRAGGHATRTVGTVVEGRPEEGRKYIDSGQLGLAALTTAAGLGLQGIEASATITAHPHAVYVANAIQYSGKTVKLGGMLGEAAGDSLAGAPGGQDQRDMQRELDSGERSAQVRTEPVNWTGEGHEKRPADMTKAEAVRRAAETVEAGLDTGLIPGMGISTGGVLPVNSGRLRHSSSAVWAPARCSA